MNGGVLRLVRLLQLASPTLPIGAYSYSQGLEWAVESGQVSDASSAKRWIGDLLDLIIAPGEAAFAWQLIAASRAGQWDTFEEWNMRFRASRETAELLAETKQMGGSLLILLHELDLLDAEGKAAAARCVPLTLPAAFALAAQAFEIDREATLLCYVWSWLESQVLAAMKLVPLGQVSGQRLLLELGARIPDVVARAIALSPEDVSTFAPGLALASSLHETQYSRLFRS